jgi:hypothetical protein
MIIILVTFISTITIFTIPNILDLLNLIELPWEGKQMIMMVAVLNFASCWTTEKVISPYVVRLIGIIRERWRLYSDTQIMYNRDIPPAKLAKFRKWLKAGKKFKVVQEEFKYEL